MNFSKLQVLRLEGNEISAGDMPSEAALCLRLATDYCRVMAVTQQQGALCFPPTLLYQNGMNCIDVHFIVGKFIVPWDVV